MRPIDAQRTPRRDTEGGETERSGAAAVDRLIATLAGEQHGVVALRQLSGLGISRDRTRGRIRRRQLHPIHRGVYAVGHSAITARGRWMAAVLASGPEAVLSHRAAARLWSLIPYGPAWLEITRPGHFRGSPGIVSHRASLPADERTSLDGIPVTTVPRTILDLAGILDRPRLERAFNEVEVRGLTDRLSIPDLLARHPHLRGTASLRAIIGERAASKGVTANQFEAAFAEMIAAAGLTVPRFNADLAVRGRFLRPDVMWEREKVIVELDGRAAHGTSLAFERDRARDRLLLLDGWRTVRVTWLQLQDTPEAVAADLRELLALSATSTLRA